MSNSIGASTIGSGTIPHVSMLRPGSVIPGHPTTAVGYRAGLQTIIVNPEEFLSSPTMKTSGIVLGDGDTQELTTLVSYGTKVDVYNMGGGMVFIGSSSGVDMDTTNTYPIAQGQEKTFNVMAGVPLYATASGAVDVRWAQY